MKLEWLILFPMLALNVAAGAQDHTQHGGHSGHVMPPVGASSPEGVVPAASAPSTPANHAADAYYDPAEMADARAILLHESGGMGNSMILIDRLEWRPGPGGDGFAWDGEGWIGGDIDRFAFKTEGEGTLGGKMEQAEVQVGWSHALDPWFNVRAGVRQDFRPEPQRTYAVLGIEGLAPYWFDVEGQIFLSDKGEVSARAEASYDQRITQRLIAQPQVELNFSAQDVPELATGSGINSIELGFRLRYEIVREFAPYVGVNWERKLGRSANYADARGDNPAALRFVTGVRFWF